MRMGLVRSVAVGALLAATAALVLVPPGRIKAFAQATAGQIITTLAGSEQIQVYPNNTAAIAYTTVSALRDGVGYQYVVPLTGFTATMTVQQSALSLNPAGTLATGTVNLPPTVIDGKTFSIYSTQIITALTLATTNGATITTPITTLAADASAAYVYSLASNAWRRIR